MISWPKHVAILYDDFNMDVTNLELVKFWNKRLVIFIKLLKNLVFLFIDLLFWDWKFWDQVHQSIFPTDFTS